MGANLFRGFYFARATSFSANEIPPNLVALVQLAARLGDDDLATDEIIELLTQDVALSVKVLSLVNSAATGLTSRVDSIHQAAVIVGRERLRTWASLIILATMDNRPAELVTMALSRAKFCELLASHSGFDNPSTHFTAGMISLLEPMTGQPVESLLDQIAVDDEIRVALVDGTGALADALDAAAALESGGPGDTLLRLPDPVLQVYQEAVSWATRVTGANTDRVAGA